MAQVWLFSPQKFGLVWFVLRIDFFFGRVNKNCLIWFGWINEELVWCSLVGLMKNWFGLVWLD